jgi:uncharacterized BrkB/YihY/UPF0761 family membrane protein
MQSLESANRSRFFAAMLLPLLAFRNIFASISELNLIFSRRGIVAITVASTLIVITGLILLIVLAVSGQVGVQFPCQQGDTSCQNARNLLGILPVIAAAIVILSGVYMMIPRFRGG